MTVVDGRFAVKRLHLIIGRVKRKTANPTFLDIVPKDGQFIGVWCRTTNISHLSMYNSPSFSHLLQNSSRTGAISG